MDFEKAREQAERFIQKGRQGEFPVGCLTATHSPTLSECAMVAGFDYLILNQEHTQLPASELVHSVRIAEKYGAITIVKLNHWDPIAARDALDLGVHGLQVPMLSGAEMLREVYRGCQFPPYGERGFCTVTRATWSDVNLAGYEEQIRSFMDFTNNHLLIVPLIETVAGLEHLDEILAFPELQIVCLGPFDLALSMGIAKEILANDPDAHHLLARAIMTIVRKTHAAGKMIMGNTTGFDIESEADTLNTLGVDYFYTSDTTCMGEGARRMIEIKAAAQIRHKQAPNRAARGK